MKHLLLAAAFFVAGLAFGNFGSLASHTVAAKSEPFRVIGVRDVGVRCGEPKYPVNDPLGIRPANDPAGIR